MRKFNLLFILSLACCFSSFATGNKIICYFNRPVNTTFSHGSDAVYLNKTMDDTLVAYINRATTSLDIAVYQLSQTGGMADIVGAINSAATRGVQVRFIYDGKDSLSTSISALSAGVHVMPSPNGSIYNIMHNKFMVIDAASANSATVWTGSTNWTKSMFETSYNNTIIIQDQPLAQAYVSEFNQMWGSTTAIPNLSLSKFGPNKTATTAHTFTIDGHLVNLYFSPSDQTNSQILSALSTADKELFFGVYTFTEGPNANTISAKYANSGMTVKGIMDNFSVGYTAYSTLSPVMGTNLKIHSGSYVYHNKMAIIDPDYPASDPQVLTGSHNWSVTADTKNDENMLIIHDSTIANQYLQSFAQNFIDLGGSISPVHPTNGIEEEETGSISIYPNPVSDMITIKSPIASAAAVTISDLSGRIILSQTIQGMENSISLNGIDGGTYMIRVSGSGLSRVYTIVKM